LNIFYLDSDPAKAAQMQCNKHVVKMVLESAQLLSTTQRLCSQSFVSDLCYKATHKNHPCTIWARNSIQNYNWLWWHAMALCEEYTFRYGKRHKSQDVIEACETVPDGNSMIYKDIDHPTYMPVAQAMPDEFKSNDPVQAYRDYYWFDKRNSIDMQWTERQKPSWWILREKEVHV
jgi:hypothetical protein